MPSSLAERLRQARHERFVGRGEERALFRQALESEELPFHLLYVHGPGGVGKTTLLRELRYLCTRGEAQGATPAVYLDARDVEPTPAAFMEALSRARERTPHFWGDGTRSVLMVDTFEAAGALQRWFQNSFLPGLSQETLVVVAGRTPPPSAWRAEDGLRALMHVCELRNLPPQESRRYLARRDVPEGERDAVVRFACGHPLALSLASDSFDQNPGQTFTPERTPELVRALLERFLTDVPSPAHHRALCACALVRSLSESLLEHLLTAEPEAGSEAQTPGVPGANGASADARGLFEWLRTLSFIEEGPRGLFPHDLAREVLVADVRWRRPERYDALSRAARRFYTAALRRAATRAAGVDARKHQRVLSDYLFLYRDNPVIAPLFARLRQQWKGRTFTTGSLRPGDEAALRDMTRRHEGDEAAALLAYWLDHPAARTTVFYEHAEDGDATSEHGAPPAGFSMRLALHETTDEDRERDPAVRAAFDHFAAHTPLRSGEEATLFRYWMDRTEHQALSPVLSLISARRVRHYLSVPAPAFTFVATADPERWALIFAYADMPRLEEADFQVGTRSYALFAHDWRATPPTEWLERMSERDIIPRSPEQVPPASPAPRLVLSREDFAKAVKQALKDFARPDRLRQNPLVRAALTSGEDLGAAESDGTDQAARANTLRRLIREAARRLRGAPKEERYFRALETTYLDPVGTQEQAAEAVGSAFSTFRRHLGRGIAHVTEVLWKRETGQALGE